MENREADDAHILSSSNLVPGMDHWSMGLKKLVPHLRGHFLSIIMMERVYCHVVGRGQVSYMSCNLKGGAFQKRICPGSSMTLEVLIEHSHRG